MCVGLNSADCQWCEDGLVPDDMLFKPPGDIKVKRTKTVRETRLVAVPNDYQLVTFQHKGPSYHLVRSTNEYRSSITWCGETGRVITLEQHQVPRSQQCERAKAEDMLTARQQVESRRAEKQ